MNRLTSPSGVIISSLYYPRIGHQSLATDNSVFVFGGINSEGNLLNTVLKINNQDLKCDVLQFPGFPPLEGFSLFSIDNGLYVWGGSHFKTTNQLWRIDGQTPILIPQEGQIPQPRYYHLTFTFSNKYIIVYGGFSQNDSFNDWYLMGPNFVWAKLKPTIDLPRNIGSSGVWISGRGILWLGEQFTNKPHFNTELYQIRMESFSEKILRIERMEIEGDIPQPRSNPVLLNLGDDLIIMGGQRLSKRQKLSGDVWFLDSKRLIFHKAEVQIDKRYGFTCCALKSKLMLVGGVNNKNQLSNKLQIIQLDNSDTIMQRLCYSCKNIYCKSTLECKNINIKLELKPSLEKETTFFYNKLSTQIPNHVDALGLLIDNALTLHASNIYLQFHTKDSLNTNYFKEKLNYILYKDNSLPLFKAAESFQSTHQSAIFHNYWINLKLASLRLSSSFIIVAHSKFKQTMITYFSKSPVECPQNNRQVNEISYFLKGDKIQQPSNRLIILRNICHILNLDQVERLDKQQLKLYLIGVNEFEKENKLLNCKVICSQNSIYNSIMQYVQRLYLETPKLSIFIQNKLIKMESLREVFKRDAEVNLISSIDMTANLNQQFKTLTMYYCRNTHYPINQIFVYYQNRLYHTINTTHYMICGYIELLDFKYPPIFKNTIPLESKSKIQQVLDFIDHKKRTNKIQTETYQKNVRKYPKLNRQ